MSASERSRRSHGSGSLYQRNGRWVAHWRVADRQVKRTLGPVRSLGTREGLTRAQAEAALRKAMAEVTVAPVAERLTVEEVGARLVAHTKAMGRKKATTETYESHIRVHLIPHFGRMPIDKITPADVEALSLSLRESGRSVKTTRNALGVLHGIFEHALRRGWVTSNPLKLVERPRAEGTDPDVRFLDHEEVEALLRTVPDDYLGRVERPLYLAATMTGMRQGELLALRWMDVDWLAQRIRVRRNFVRGEFGTPKSKRSSRSVPLADRVAVELDALHRQTAFGADADLVFAHPHTGKPIDRSKLLKRYKLVLKAAGVREVRFHDLRHTFGTTMAGAGVPMRTLQEWMGHRDFATTLIYADYLPAADEADVVARAFAGSNPGSKLSESGLNSAQLSPVNTGDPGLHQPA